MTYHCARYYNTGLTIYQLQVLIIPDYLIIPLLLHMYVQTIFPSTHIHNSTTYIYIYTYLASCYSIPNNSHISISTISTYFLVHHFTTKIHQYSFIHTIYNPIYPNSITNNFINDFIIIYNQDSLTSIYPYNLQSNISQLNHIYFYQQFHNHKYIPISSTSIYHHNSQSKYITTQSHIFSSTISTIKYHQHHLINKIFQPISHNPFRYILSTNSIIINTTKYYQNVNLSS